MNKRVKLCIFTLVFLLIVLAISLIYFINQYMILKNKQSKNFGNSVIYSEKINNHKTVDKNILFIGNSITYHGICSYWFGSWGMASSSRDNDFVHLVVKKLGKNNNVNYAIVPFYFWETNAHDRNEFLPMLDDALKTQNDYVVIQLGENVTNFSSYERDYIDLINYIKDKTPNVKIVVMGNFQFATTPKKTKGKISACKKTQVEYIDLSDIDNEKYYLGSNKKVLGDDNKYHLIEHEGVMLHPNDKAMQVYADRIYDALINNE